MKFHVWYGFTWHYQQINEYPMTRMCVMLADFLFFLLTQGSAGHSQRGSRWVLFLKTVANHQSASWANLQPTLLHHAMSNLTPFAFSATLLLFTCSLSPCLLCIHLYLSFFPWLGVKAPAARSSGDKSDLPNCVIIKHPLGRLRPPHPFNSSVDTVSQERRSAFHAAA